MDSSRLRQLAGGAANLQLAVFADHGDAGGIVAAIFEAAEPVQDQGYDFLRADVSDNAAHGGISLRMETGARNATGHSG